MTRGAFIGHHARVRNRQGRHETINRDRKFTALYDDLETLLLHGAVPLVDCAEDFALFGMLHGEA
ncbi:hypothetical protein, partial [Burkholderia contaminans]|uniref:hypothetical protein n=1 Tax=Burkholderia contaminans TaxID=488447 RepID=UPI002D80B5F6